MATEIASTPHARLLSMAAVLDRGRLSNTQLYRLIAFLEREVTSWIDARVRLRDEGVGNETRRQRAMHAVSRSSRPACLPPTHAALPSD